MRLKFVQISSEILFFYFPRHSGPPPQNVPKFPGDFANGDAFPVHAELIPKHGIYILENMVTEELIEDGVDRFMFVLGQARLEGAVQMIINPVAIR